MKYKSSHATEPAAQSASTDLSDHLSRLEPSTPRLPVPGSRLPSFSLLTSHISLLVLVALLLLLAACGEPTPPTPPVATATAEGPAPIVETPSPSPTAVTLGQAPATPIPPTIPPTITPRQADLESEYVRQATIIVSGIITAPEISDAVASLSDAATNALFGGNVDVNSLADKLDKAAGIVSDAGGKFAKLNPPPSYKPTHDRFIAVFQKYNDGFTRAQTALNTGDWLALTSAVADIVAATDELNTLSKELGGPGY